jgi:hypothetical protein
MKNASNPRRGRGRNSGKRNQNSRGSGADNDGKIRGSAQQVLDKYLILARDASSSGDRIAAEGYFQHAEHYHRVLNSDGGRPNNQQNRSRNNELNKKQLQADAALSKVLEVGTAPVKQVEDTFKETAAEPLMAKVEVVKEKPHRRAIANAGEPTSTEVEDNKAPKTTI